MGAPAGTEQRGIASGPLLMSLLLFRWPLVRGLLSVLWLLLRWLLLRWLLLRWLLLRAERSGEGRLRGSLP